MKKIAVRTCGGCFCEFDRRKIFDDLSAAFKDEFEFKFSYDISKDDEYSLVVLINGCDSECAPRSETNRMLVIDHTNHDRALDVFREASSSL